MDRATVPCIPNVGRGKARGRQPNGRVEPVYPDLGLAVAQTPSGETILLGREEIVEVSPVLTLIVATFSS